MDMQFKEEKRGRGMRGHSITRYEFRCYIFKFVGNLNLYILVFQRCVINDLKTSPKDNARGFLTTGFKRICLYNCYEKGLMI